MAWQRKVNRHVTYLATATHAGIDNFVKRRSAIITALGAGDLVNIRIGHHGETYTNVDRKEDPFSATTGEYVSW